jgi:osmotically-inducible protein OsmY
MSAGSGLLIVALVVVLVAALVAIDTDTVVTLSGTVNSIAERGRGMQVAREVEGVTSVTDRLQVAK